MGNNDIITVISTVYRKQQRGVRLLARNVPMTFANIRKLCRQSGATFGCLKSINISENKSIYHGFIGRQPLTSFRQILKLKYEGFFLICNRLSIFSSVFHEVNNLTVFISFFYTLIFKISGTASINILERF